jgi:hypothetical protein
MERGGKKGAVMKIFKRVISSIFWPKPRISPQGFLAGGIQIAILYFIFHAIGLLEYVSILSGTLPSPDMNLQLSLFLGSVYILLYFGFYILTPVFLISSGLFYLIEKRFSPKKQGVRIL